MGASRAALVQWSALTLYPDSTGVRERRGCLAADNRWGLVDQLVILEGFYHEEGEVHAACHVALKDGSPTCRLHTGRPWLSPSSRSLPRTTVHRVSLANTRRHASTWSLTSANRRSRAIGPPHSHD